MDKGLFGKPVGKCRQVNLAPDLIDRIHQYAYGGASGGHQGFSQEILGCIEAGDLSYDDEMLGKAWRYAYCYGEGGWQNMFRAILSAIRSRRGDESDRTLPAQLPPGP